MCCEHGSALRRRQTSKPSHAGHHHVEQHHIGPLTRADVQRFRAAMSRTHLEIVGGKARLEQLDVGVGVVDDEYTCGQGVATVPRR
jgi:hypothetical protein